jgi:hypothetical protein
MGRLDIFGRFNSLWFVPLMFLIAVPLIAAPLGSQAFDVVAVFFISRSGARLTNTSNEPKCTYVYYIGNDCENRQRASG